MVEFKGKISDMGPKEIIIIPTQMRVMTKKLKDKILKITLEEYHDEE